MGKQTKTKKTEILGKGKVTPVQVAFIVDRYLSDNNYIQTRSSFRSEASTLISKAQGREAPKTLLSLGAILDEYICLKEQKVMLEQEKIRVEALLRGLQNVVHSYNSSGIVSPLSMSIADTNSMALIRQSDPSANTPAGHPMYSTPVINSNPRISSISLDPKNSTTMSKLPPKNKRKSSRPVPDAPSTGKRSCSQPPMMMLPTGGTNISSNSTNTPITQETVPQLSVIPSSPCKQIPNRSPLQGSNVATSLFKQNSPSLVINSPGPKTPPQASPSQSDQLVSPLESSVANSANINSPQNIAPTNYSVISSEMVAVSPFKHVAYYSMERNHYISSSPNKTNPKRLVKRDHVKGRLDFDGSGGPRSLEEPMTAEISTSVSSRQAGIFDMDIPNFDVFGADFSFSELLVDLDGEGFGFPSQPLSDPSGSPHESGDEDLEVNEIFSELSSTVMDILSEKDMNIQGSDSLTSVKSITKCIRIISPAKKRQSCMLDQENSSVRN